MIVVVVCWGSIDLEKENWANRLKELHWRLSSSSYWHYSRYRQLLMRMHNWNLGLNCGFLRKWKWRNQILMIGWIEGESCVWKWKHWVGIEVEWIEWDCWDPIQEILGTTKCRIILTLKIESSKGEVEGDSEGWKEVSLLLVLWCLLILDLILELDWIVLLTVQRSFASKHLNPAWSLRAKEKEPTLIKGASCQKKSRDHSQFLFSSQRTFEDICSKRVLEQEVKARARPNELDQTALIAFTLSPSFWSLLLF